MADIKEVEMTFEELSESVIVPRMPRAKKKKVRKAIAKKFNIKPQEAKKLPICAFERNGKYYVALVRKLTERECYRLMGVDDEDIDKLLAAPIARTAHYKLAGNSIIKDCLMWQFEQAFLSPSNKSAQMDLFGGSEQTEPLIRYDKDRPLRVVTLCSGYDSQCLALEALKKKYPWFCYDLVAWAEFDPTSKTPLDKQPAVVAHNALFPQWKDRNMGDMTKIDWVNHPLLKGKQIDLLFYSTPCQSISQAGLQHGFVEGSGTRSSIIWFVRDAIAALKPRYACLENVEAMVSEKFLPMFNLWQETLTYLGYQNYAKVLNGKNFNVPQNRSRIFLWSLRNDVEQVYYFPEPMALTRTLPQVLEEETDTRYYLNPVKVNQFVQDNLVMIGKYMDESQDEIEKLPEHLAQWLKECEDGVQEE